MSTQPKSYLDHEPKIKTQAQMLEVLKARTAASASPKLKWNKPVRNPDDTGHQTAAGTDYEIRKTITKGNVMYWAWWNKKLLGYSIDVELARNHCESHHLGDGK